MTEWISCEDKHKPDKYQRVLLAIDYEDVPVIGYYDGVDWFADCSNHAVSCGPYCYGGQVTENFHTSEVNYWMILPDMPKDA